MIEILHNKENTEKIEFVAADGEEILGRCAGGIDGGAFVIDELDCPDFFADGLIRAILNLADLHGITSARFDLPEKTELLKKLGFVKGENCVIPDIAEFFGDKSCG
ncbi:MAG: hypothetical protein ACI4XA_07095 [Oscillospiraceae bacterium]